LKENVFRFREFATGGMPENIYLSNLERFLFGAKKPGHCFSAVEAGEFFEGDFLE